MKKFICFFGIVCYMLLLAGLSAAIGSGEFKMAPVKGVVNLDEIGGSNLGVFSLWNNPAISRVSQNGEFVTVVSRQRPQKVSLIDKNKQTRALALFLPGLSDKLIFDAESTATAALFYDVSFFKQTAQVQKICDALKSKSSFKELVVFLRNNLRSNSLEELINNNEYRAILEKCNKEAFGEDSRVIEDSLRAAEKELQKTLQ